MVWCSLRFADAIRTDPKLWEVEHDVIMGASKTKTKRVNEWVAANYARGDQPRSTRLIDRRHCGYQGHTRQGSQEGKVETRPAQL
ncbi:hypothetical protein N9L68_00820 [bacterium]|nr:hypothetical protein [bacterium]